MFLMPWHADNPISSSLDCRGQLVYIPLISTLYVMINIKAMIEILRCYSSDVLSKQITEA